MVLAAPEALTAPTQDGTVHWTRFPAAAAPIDWSDHRAAHHAVMRLFADDLAGPAGAVRSHCAILFRVDVVGDQPVVLVQSRVAPMLTPPQARTMTLSGPTWETTDGDQIRFRLAINPLIRNGKTEKVVPAAETGDWVVNRLTNALSDVTVLNHYRDTSEQKHHGRTIKGGDRLTIDTIDGIATVTDAALLDQLRLEGVGRRKAYGAGLLTVQRVG